MNEKEEALRVLLEKVKAHRITNVEQIADLLDRAGFMHAFSTHGPHLYRAYNGSLDAAKALHDALLPGWSWLVGLRTVAVSVPDEPDGTIGTVAGQTGFVGQDDNPARAWLIAILRALIAMREGGDDE